MSALNDLFETLSFRAGFNTSTVILGTSLLGLASGVVGVFALLRKRSLMGDAISHATLPGIAIAFLAAGWLGTAGRELPVLQIGAAIAGTLGVLAVHAILRHSRLREDAAIGIVLGVFFGIGIVALSYIQKNAPAGSAGLTRFIYGQAAATRPDDVALMGAIACLVIATIMLLRKELALVSFNDAFARSTGWPVGALDLTIMLLVVLITVAGLQAVGLLLVIAMLIIPPVTARFWTDRLGTLLLLAGLFGALSGYIGSAVSALLPRLPTGAVIVLTAGTLFIMSLLGAPSRGLLAAGLRRMRLRVRIAGEHLLEAAHHRSTERDGTTLEQREINELAGRRGWSPPFKAVVLLALRVRGMLRREGDALAITPRGAERGARIARNHALWERYLIAQADIAPSHIDWSVDLIEHVLPESLIAELESAHPQRDGGAS